jgi:CRP/FNR family transcriptional regulator, cyclic AMP receptor protein
MADLDVNELAKVSKLFDALDASARLRLLSLSHQRRAAAGEVICREGDPGGEFFVISSGEVCVTCNALEGERAVARLSPGAFFGEMAVLNGDRRTATCTAVVDTELVAFPIAAIEQILEDHPAAREVLVRVGMLRMQEMME